VHLLRVLMRMEPCVPEGRVRLAPVLPESFAPIAIDEVPLAGARVSVEIDHEVRVRGLPSDIELILDEPSGFAPR
jgi:hypothetical protein